MKNISLSLICSLILFLCFSCSTFNIPSVSSTSTSSSTNSNNTTTSGTKPTENEIIRGLKEALIQGSGKASSLLNKTDGYNLNPKVRIPFPEDAKRVSETLRQLGYGKKVDEFEIKLNRAAEQAAKEASPIFANAITQMSIADAQSILLGSDNAATNYLKKTTYNSLYDAFTPHIQTALNNTLAASLWTELTTLYNKLPTTNTKIQTDLVSYTANKSLNGLFTLVAEEELKIRKDPVARTSDILKKVFGSNK